jgi:hypothetical protein
MAPEARTLDLIVGAAIFALSLLLLAACLTILESARLSLFRSAKSLVPSDGLSCLVDGVDVLRRHGWRAMSTVVGYWGLGVAACVAFSAAGSWLAAVWPSELANAVTWAIGQVGIGAALVFRVAGWRRVWAWVNE